MIPERLAELDRRRRRRLVLHAVVMLAATWIGLGFAYYIIPLDHFSSGREIARLVLGLVAVCAVLYRQTGRIMRAKHPELQAVEALGAIIPLFLLVFATLYLSLSYANPANFSQQLDHTRALYFTITTFSTVGFGDITPTVDATRIFVSLQMLLDLVIIGVVVRFILNAAKTGLSRTTEDDPDQG